MIPSQKHLVEMSRGTRTGAVRRFRRKLLCALACADGGPGPHRCSRTCTVIQKGPTMNRFFSFVLFLAAITFPELARADLKVVATVPMLGAMASEIGGGHAEVKVLSLPTQDPHFLDAKPSLALDLNHADLLLVVGLGLESGWLPVLQQGARNPKILTGARGYLDVSGSVDLLERAANVDRAMGDIHAGGNPHFLFDPRAVQKLAPVLADRMAELDPANAGLYRQKSTELTTQIGSQLRPWAERAGALRDQPFVAYHGSWAYLSSWLGLRQIALLEPKPGIPPNAAHVAEVLAQARASNVKLLLQETYYPDATAKLIAEKIGARIVRIAGGPAPGQTVIGYFDALVGQLVGNP